MFYFLNNFLFFSIIGYFFETIMFNILNMHNQSGFMYLWWTPFYGTGVIITILVSKYFNKKFTNKKIKNILMFISLFIILTLLEYIGGTLLEFLHGYSLWTYEHIPLHIGKYISVGTSLAWVIFAFIYIYVLKKYTDKLINKIPKFITIIVALIFIADFIYTLFTLIKIQLM